MKWTEENVKYLTKHYPKTDDLDLSIELETTIKSVVSKAKKLGLQKTKTFLKKQGK